LETNKKEIEGYNFVGATPQISSQKTFNLLLFTQADAKAERYGVLKKQREPR